jgi:hypothetical protein
MRLYSGSSALFIQDAYQNQIAEKLKLSFFEHFRYHPPDSEIRSWQNSLRALSQVFERSNLLDHGILLEYQLPMTSKRMDCLVCGKDDSLRDQAIIIELKQWDRCEEAIGENEVVTWLNGAKREVLHPSVQVGQYQMYLEDTHTAFYEGASPVLLSSCAFLHNYLYDASDVILMQNSNNRSIHILCLPVIALYIYKIICHKNCLVETDLTCWNGLKKVNISQARN